MSVFLASPSDLTAERKAFVAELRRLNRGWGQDNGIVFEPLVWEQSVTPAGARIQGLLNRMIDRCDIFILALHRHWGQPAPDSGYDSYSEEEFHRAIDRLSRRRKRGVRIFVFLKDIPRKELASPDPQLTKVLSFRAELERTRIVLARTFSNVRGFRKLVRDHICADAGATGRDDLLVERLPLRLELIERVNRARTRAKRRAGSSKQADDELVVLDLARQAAKAAGSGALEEARQKFARVTASTVNGEALFLAYDFYRNMNDVRAMQDVLKMALAYYGPDTVCVDTASALAQLGMLHLDRGNLSQAERLQRKSLEINRELGSEKGVADQLCRLGIVLMEKDEIAAAEQMFDESIRLNQRIDRPLGLRFAYFQSAAARFRTNDHERAERLVRKAQRIDRKHGWTTRLARDYRLLAEIQMATEAYDAALRSLGKARALFDGSGLVNEAIDCRQAADRIRSARDVR